MVRNLNLEFLGNDISLNKIKAILSDINIHGVNIFITNNQNNEFRSDFIVKSQDVPSPIIEGKREIVEDLCHSSRSLNIPCSISESDDNSITISIPHLPEEELDGLKPTMCLENQIRFFEIILTRYIKKWLH